KHDAIAQKLAKMAAQTFAIEAMVRYTSSLVDLDKKNDIRIEAAMAKLWGTERGWDIVDDTMQIRGGRGYETAQSLEARGEPGIPVERMMRDCRINTIFEGSTEIMRLFIAREALDPHLKIGGPVLNTTLPTEVRLKAAVQAAGRYALWYPRLWIPFLTCGSDDVARPFRREARRIRNDSRRLARRLFHAMLRHGPKLDKKQVLLGRFVDAGAELYAQTACLAWAGELIKKGEAGDAARLVETVKHFCQLSQATVKELFREVGRNSDSGGYQLARKLIHD
ncbi:MAG: DNA polymerase II, partial [Verrucomicrobiae bacterium]|nr:DNA polymerase II [Verrucomicrobiae bacterium]